MKHYAVVLFDATKVDEYTDKGKSVFTQIRNALKSFRKNKIRVCSMDTGGKTSYIQVHQAESVDTQSLLLVKGGVMSNVVDTTDLLTRDDQMAKLAELQTAHVLLRAAEEHLLLSVAQMVYSDLPMDVNNKRDVSSQEAIAKINKMIADHPVVRRSAEPKVAGERVFKYITQHADALKEQIFIGTI